MNWTNLLLGFVRSHGTSIILALSAISLFLVVFNIGLFVRLGKLSKRKEPALAMKDGLSYEYIEELARRLDRSETQLELTDQRIKALDGRLAYSVQRVGMVRFDAFVDVGGEQSFALALLDREMNGVVFSSIYSRSESRVYAKVVTDGRSQHALSDEERDAIRQAGAIER
jgi:hypothetical protein